MPSAADEMSVRMMMGQVDTRRFWRARPPPLEPAAVESVALAHRPLPFARGFTHRSHLVPQAVPQSPAVLFEGATHVCIRAGACTRSLPKRLTGLALDSRVLPRPVGPLRRGGRKRWNQENGGDERRNGLLHRPSPALDESRGMLVAPRALLP